MNKQSDTTGQRERTEASPVLVGCALGVFILGLFVYVFDREAGSAIGLPDVLHLSSKRAPDAGLDGRIFGALGGSLPSFAHVFAFSLLSVALLPRGRRFVLAACVFWGAVNVCFEYLQQPAWSRPAAEWLRSNVTTLPGGESLARYLVNGRFDANDLIAAALGALAALAVALLFRSGPLTPPRKPA